MFFEQLKICICEYGTNWKIFHGYKELAYYEEIVGSH